MYGMRAGLSLVVGLWFVVGASGCADHPRISLSTEEAAKKLAPFFKDDTAAKIFMAGLERGHLARIRAVEKRINTDAQIKPRMDQDPIGTLGDVGFYSGDSDDWRNQRFEITRLLTPTSIEIHLQDCRWKLSCDTCVYFEGGGDIDPHDPSTYPTIITYPCNCRLYRPCSD